MEVAVQPKDSKIAARKPVKKSFKQSDFLCLMEHSDRAYY